MLSNRVSTSPPSDAFWELFSPRSGFDEMNILTMTMPMPMKMKMTMDIMVVDNGQI